MTDRSRTFWASLLAVGIGIAVFFAALSGSNAIKSSWLPKPTPVPTIPEILPTLTEEEASTMSGSFIKDFENIMASASGNR